MSYQPLSVKVDRGLVVAELLRRVKDDGRHHLSPDVCRLLWGDHPAVGLLEMQGIQVHAEARGWELTTGVPARPENGRLF